MGVVSNSVNVAYATFSGYNALGQPGQIAFQNGASTSLTYYPLNNRLQEMSTTTPGNGKVQDFTYGYDNNGNILTIADNVTSANTQTFTYDWLNRLTTAQSQSYNTPGNTINFNPDVTGNITTNAETGTADRNSVPAIVYDYDNRITGYGGTTFVYNYQGRRVKKIGADATTYVSKLYDVNTTKGVTRHIFAGGRRIASINGSNTYYYHLDHLGSLNIATDAGGNVQQTVNYYPYGAVRTNSGSVDLPYKFTGKELDNETGLYYFGARYYDAAQGRFITPDTIVQSPGDPQSLNRYAYAGNNPLAFVDPTGHGFFSFLESFFEAFISVFVGAVLTFLTGNPILGCMAASAISGAFNGHVSLTSVVTGAFMPPPMSIGLSLSRGGFRLDTFFGGLLGGLAGGAAGGAFVYGLNKMIDQGLADAGDLYKGRGVLKDNASVIYKWGTIPWLDAGITMMQYYNDYSVRTDVEVAGGVLFNSSTGEFDAPYANFGEPGKGISYPTGLMPNDDWHYAAFWHTHGNFENGGTDTLDFSIGGMRSDIATAEHFGVPILLDNPLGQIKMYVPTTLTAYSGPLPSGAQPGQAYNLIIKY